MERRNIHTPPCGDTERESVHEEMEEAVSMNAARSGLPTAAAPTTAQKEMADRRCYD
jgi:hypothetical protein